MTPREIVLACVAAGAQVKRLADGKATIFGEIPGDVMEAIRADREAFLVAWDEYASDRYGISPPECLMLAPKHPTWTNETRKLCHDHVTRQGPEVMRWCLMRAEAYGKVRDWSDRHRMNAAVRDVIHWQMERYKNPEAVLASLDEAYKDLKK